jgi:hypothetical protein
MAAAIFMALAVAAIQIATSWSPFQRHYLPDLGAYALARVLNVSSTEHSFVEVKLDDGRADFGRDADFIAGEMRGIDGHMFEFAPSQYAINLHRTRVFVGEHSDYPTATLGHLLRIIAFPDLTIWDFSELPCATSIIALIVGLWIALPYDKERAGIRRFGRRIRGPEFVSASEFGRRLGADGIGFLNKKHGLQRFLSKEKCTLVRIPLKSEESGILVLGATGVGKSCLAFQLLDQAIRRGDRLVVVDPALEILQRFLMPERDIILNAGDRRTKAWDLAAEVGNRADARMLASSMLPHRKGENPFFVEAAQRVLSELLMHRPSTKDLSSWLADPVEVDRRLAGTSAARMIDPLAGPQRVGVLATLAMFGEALESLPDISPEHEAWSSVSWTQTGTGVIFLPFPQTMREHMRPLLGTWLDLLIYRTQLAGKTPGKKTWFIIDEMPALGLLPALTSALTENRKSGNPIVTFVQDKSQIDAVFGEIGSTMLSMPQTKIIFRVSEPTSSKWASQALGNVEYEQLRESESTNPNQGQSRSEHNEFVTRPLVMPEELDGLPPLHGYIKHGNLVTQLETVYFDFPLLQPGFVPRVEPIPSVPLPPTTKATSTETSKPKLGTTDNGLLFD